LGEISETLAGKTERTARRIYTTIYELDSPDAIATPQLRAMRGWYQFRAACLLAHAGGRSSPGSIGQRVAALILAAACTLVEQSAG